MSKKDRYLEAKERYSNGQMSTKTYLDQIAYLNIELYSKVEDQLIQQSSDINESKCTTILSDTMWSTCRPSDTYNYEDIYNKVHRFVTKYKNITDTILSYEQAGLSEETIGKGLHVHIIFKHTYKK